ncbi:MAG: hypothetical protein M1839_000537 [Geoglossum umbratile]|nr:MAG: hypothetical protein M1839_000537 [Geoglossum umbratile]
MAAMKALVVEAVGKPIALIERPVPVPEEGEVLIKVTVVGLNPYDHRVRDWGLYVEGRLPVVLGNDIAGVVEQLGPGVTADFKPGDHIFGQTNYLKGTSDQNGLQEYALLDAYTAAKIPSNLTDDDGASLVCNIVASFWAIFGAHGLNLAFPFPGQKPTIDYSSQTIVIIGAGSNCGKYAVQSCALAGFGTIVTTASKAKNESDLLSYGATHVLDRHAPDIDAQIRAVVGDDLIYAFDAVNVDHTLGVSVLSSTKRGTLACIVPGKADETKIGEKKAGYEDKFIQGQSHNQPALGAAFWKNLPRWMEQGKIRATGWDVIEGLDREKVDKVLDDYRDGRQPPKQVHVHL